MQKRRRRRTGCTGFTRSSGNWGYGPKRGVSAVPVLRPRAGNSLPFRFWPTMAFEPHSRHHSALIRERLPDPTGVPSRLGLRQERAGGLDAKVAAQAEVAARFARAGAGARYVGELGHVDLRQVVDAVGELLARPDTLRRMSDAAMDLVDGCGAERVANTVMDAR